ncbi:MAG: HNH endonuclease [Planctomycetes bacterium]|nr:HNH endonuclease [Planctomycetota bacterium]
MPSRRRRVWDRAGGRCEYCQLPQDATRTPHEIDHIRPRKHAGRSTLDNLALACFYCNSYKQSNVAGYDPDTDELVPLFHPRQQIWADHFEWQAQPNGGNPRALRRGRGQTCRSVADGRLTTAQRLPRTTSAFTHALGRGRSNQRGCRLGRFVAKFGHATTIQGQPSRTGAPSGRAGSYGRRGPRNVAVELRRQGPQPHAATGSPRQRR